MQLDDISRRVVQKRLAAGPDGDWVGQLDPPRSQLVHDGVEIGDADGEVLAEVGGNASFDEVDLLGAEVDPGPTEPEVRPVVSESAPEQAGVERHAFGGVGHVERDVVDAERFHEPESGGSWVGVQRQGF